LRETAPDLIERDQRLVVRLLDGEEAAFQELFDGHFPSLYRFALRRVAGDHGMAEDAVQSTLLRAVEKLETYRGEAPLLSWLYTICRREAYALLRRGGRGHESTLAEDSPEVRAVIDSLPASLASGPEAKLLDRDLKRLVEATLDALPPHYGDALDWKYLEGASVREIADRLGIGPKAAESLLTRARGAFRQVFSAMAGACAEIYLTQGRERGGAR